MEGQLLLKVLGEQDGCLEAYVDGMLSAYPTATWEEILAAWTEYQKEELAK